MLFSFCRLSFGYENNKYGYYGFFDCWWSGWFANHSQPLQANHRPSGTGGYVRIYGARYTGRQCRSCPIGR